MEIFFQDLFKIHRGFIFTLLLIPTAFCFGQNSFKLSGEAKESNGQALEFADIVLLNQDSSVYKFSFIEEGQFSIDEINSGDYIIYINSLDCDPFYKPVEITDDTIIDFILNRSGVELDEVTIALRRKIFDTKDGNITFNIENTILKAEPNLTSLMSKIPYIQMTPDGESISIVGRGTPLIYHNNQRIDLNRLNNISVDEIESIEIINNPSTKYEAEGRSVVLIKTKNKVREGYKVDLSETISQREFFNNYLGLNSNFNLKNSEFKLNMGLNQLKPWEKLSTNYEILNNDLSSENVGISTADRNEYILGAGFFYPINDKDFFSTDYSTRIIRTFGDINAQSIYTLRNSIDEIETHTENQDNRDYHNAIVNFNKGFENGNLFIGTQYSKFKQSVGTFIENNFNQEGFLPTQDRDQDFNIDSYSARVDYEISSSSGNKLEFGLNSTFSTAQTHQTIVPLDDRVNKTLTNYDYVEKIYAAYLQRSRSLGSMSFSGGIRIEQADVEGKFTNSTSPLIDRNNLFVLPKAQMSFPFDSLTTLTINYARNINRPNFSNLNQIEVYINPFLVFSRNINLLPTVTNEVAANIQRKSSSLRLSFFMQTNPVNWSSSYDETIDLFKTTLRNFERMYGMSAMVNVPLNYKKWTSFNTLSFNLNQIKDPNAILLSSTPFIYFYTNHSFILPGDFSLNFNAWGFTKRNEGAYERNALIVAGIGVSRILYEKLSLTFSFNNIFNNRSFEERSSVDSVQSFNQFFVDNREFSLSLKYSFGQIKSKFEIKDVSDNSNRVR